MDDAAERQLLLLMAREPDPERDDKLRHALAASVNWDHLVSLAGSHGLVPQLTQVVSEAAWGASAPPPVIQQVRMLNAALRLRANALFGVLAHVLDGLEAANVQPIVLKGPALASTVYPDPALRMFSDLDVLCPEDQFAAAATVLVSQGYRAQAQSEREQDGFHVVYQREAGGAPIELHSDLLQLGLPTRCIAALWREGERFEMGGHPALMLGLEHQILHLCVHLHTHGYTRLIWFKDLDLVLRRRIEQVDWPKLQALAASEGVSLSLRHTLSLLRELLETPLPAGCLAGFARDPLGEAAHAVLWPRRRVARLAGKQRLRSLRFNPHRGLANIVPSLVVMGRRREKLAMLAAVRQRRVIPAVSGDDTA